MTIKQEDINGAYSLLSELAKKISSEARGHIDKLENNGNPEDFKRAQSAKIKANELDLLIARMRSDHPHLCG